MTREHESETVSPSDLLRIEAICDRFESDWQTGTVRPIDEYLREADSDCQALLRRELTAVDNEYRQAVARNSQAIDRSSPGTAGVAPRRVAQFELLARLGAGAFGTVWKAKDTRLDRIVALKLAHPNQVDEPERFLREARAAAQLKHSHIVRVLDAGEFEGQLYIVREFIEGCSLADRLQTEMLEPRRAAEIVSRLADALVHSHQLGIIHRDIKPQNVLIDGDGEPHLTDFGLAKYANPNATGTHSGLVMGTPSYMAPEQARGASHAADARTDVYSLGVLLFQLLTGELPFRGTLEMIVLQLLHDEPPSPAKLRRDVSTDLGTICLKCMEKDPRKRYASALALRDELGRFLDGRPILARPLSAMERARRWAARNPKVASLVGGILLLAITVAAGAVAASMIVTTAWRNERDQRQQAEAARLRARREETRAKTEAALAERVTTFLENIFVTSDPIGLNLQGIAAYGGEKRTARELLDEATRRIETELASEPRVQARLMDVIGNVYRSLGRFQEAERLLDQAAAVRSRQTQLDSELDLRLEHATHLFFRGWLKQAQGEFDEADVLYGQALYLREQVLGVDSLLAAEVEFQRGALQLERKSPRAAETIFTRVLAVRQAHLPTDHRLIAVTELALLYCAERRETLPDLPAFAGELLKNDAAGRVAINYWTMAQARRDKDFATAIAKYQEILAVLREGLGNEHPSLALALGEYAGLLGDAGDVQAAYPAVEEALRIARLHGSRHPQMVPALIQLGNELLMACKFDDAARCFRDTIQLQPTSQATQLEARQGLASALFAAGHHQEGLSESHRMMDFVAVCPPEKAAWAHYVHSRMLAKSDDAAAVARHDAEAIQLVRNLNGTFSTPHWTARAAIIFAHANDYGRAEELLRQALEAERLARPPEHPRVADHLQALANLLVRTGRNAEAKPLVEEAWAIREKRLPSWDRRLQQTREARAALGKLEP